MVDDVAVDRPNLAVSKPTSPEVKARTQPVRVGNVSIGGPNFVVIAGPCSIESEQQFSRTGASVREFGASLMRGGIWKLRTSRLSFQGLGDEAAHIAKSVRASTGLGFVSEITDPRQVEVLDPIIDMYQVGARNMHNYALLKELSHTQKPVLLKRNFSALIDEWLKAAEYIMAGGNSKIVLCERGIRTFENATRFTFDLNAVAWVKANTDFPIIVDPSHAVGQSSLVPSLCYAAAAAGADGLIVEVHPSPSEALSDGQQSLSIGEFAKMMNRLERILDAVERPLNRI